VGIQGPHLVVLGLEDGNAAHGRLRRRNEREVFTGDAQKNLPVQFRKISKLLGKVRR